jgi:outer membrane immunogenic protein
MRRIFFISTALVALLPSAVLAADLQGKPALPAPASWSGFYAGLNAGLGWSPTSWRNTASTPAATFFDYLPGQGFSDTMSGILGGAQVGINFQNGPWVYGAEAAISGADIYGDFKSVTGAADDQFRARLNALFLATGRLGYAWNDNLVYGKAGFAAAKLYLSVSDPTAPTTGSGSDSQWRSGWTVGLGLEHRLTPQLSLAVEYDYIDLGSDSYELGGSAGTYSWTFEPELHLLMLRLNYRFAGI